MCRWKSGRFHDDRLCGLGRDRVVQTVVQCQVFCVACTWVEAVCLTRIEDNRSLMDQNGLLVSLSTIAAPHAQRPTPHAPHPTPHTPRWGAGEGSAKRQGE